MLNVKELERKWLIYKIKSYLPFGIAFVISLVLIIFLATSNSKNELKKEINTTQELTKKVIEKPSIDFLYKIENNTTKSKNNTPKPKDIIKKEQVVEEVSIPEQNTTIHETKKTPTIIEPSLGFMNEIETKPKKQNNTLTIEPSMGFMQQIENQPLGIIKNNKPKKTKTKPKPKPIQIQKKQKPIVKKKIIQIKRDSSKLDIDKLVKRFEKKKDPRLSLFIAEKYYANKKYKEAYDYALITNQIDPNLEQSWILFSKTLVKLGQKERAIRTLTKYINYSKSSNAKLLLDDIKTRKFKWDTY